jgi:hypothetical protein
MFERDEPNCTVGSGYFGIYVDGRRMCRETFLYCTHVSKVASCCSAVLTLPSTTDMADGPGTFGARATSIKYFMLTDMVLLLCCYRYFVGCVLGGFGQAFGSCRPICEWFRVRMSHRTAWCLVL